MAKIVVRYDDPRYSFLKDAGEEIEWGRETATLEIDLDNLRNRVAETLQNLPPEAFFCGWTLQRNFKFGRRANLKRFGGYFDPDVPAEIPEVGDLGEVAAHNLNYALRLTYEDVGETGSFVHLEEVNESRGYTEGAEGNILGIVVEFEGNFTLVLHPEIVFRVGLHIHKYATDTRWDGKRDSIFEVSVEQL